MISKISDIVIKGEFFEEPVKWTFKSKNEKDRLFLIYGPNGSGKTTFSKSLYEYKTSIDGAMKNFEQVDFLDDGNNVLPIDRNKIWSFNDEFIQKNVRLKNSGLNAIVMFGEAADIDEKIEEKLKLKEEIKKQIKDINLSKYGEPKNPNNISEAYQVIINTLKNEWATNDRDIKGNSKASSVNDGIVEKILKEKKPKDNISKLKRDYIDKMALYKTLPKDSHMINSHLIINNLDVDEGKIINLLSKQINKPIIDELGEKIISELDRQNIFVNLDVTKNVISSSDICPVCFQPISNEHKSHIIEAINNIFNDEAKNHIDELDGIIIPELNRIDFTPFIDVVEGITQSEINKSIDEINNLIREYNLQIEKKKQNVFMPIEFVSKNLNNKINNLSKVINSQNDKINEYNNNVKNIDDIKDSLFTLNNQIAQLTINDLYNKYCQLNENKEKDIETFNKLDKQVEEYDSEIKTLNAKKKNLDLGLKEINDDLMMIFNSRKKLQLELDNGLYFVRSGSRRIQFNNLSVGEKNIIGLCYFFSLIRNGHSKSDVFNDDLLIVLDDPISSFDFNNKYGIYSFIKKMTGEILEKNKESKVIILSHELDTMVNLDKIRADFGYTKIILMIKNKELKEYKLDSSLYVNMMNSAISVANNPDIPSDNINIARRILEAFSAFVYRKKLTEFARDKEIFALIENEKIRSHLSSSVYTFVLNEESHMEDLTRSIPENLCYDTWSNDNKCRAIKDIFILIYALNKMHLKKILPTEEFIIVENWYKELENIL